MDGGAESSEVRMKRKVHDWQEDVSDMLFCLCSNGHAGAGVV